MSARTITFKTLAWVTKYSIRDFSIALQQGDDQQIGDAVNFSPNERMGTGKDAWTQVGQATITVSLAGEKKVVASAVKALRSQQRAIRAEAEKDAIDIERQIQQLLAITNEVSP